jgi:hypothetical protein
MLSVFLLLLFSLASCQDEYQINEEFAPEGVDHDVSSSDKWGYLYPPPSAPSELKLAFNDRMRKGMMGRSWPSILVMGDLDSCSKILIALHGRSFEFSGPIMHIFQHMVMSYNVAVVLPRAPNVKQGKEKIAFSFLKQLFFFGPFLVIV